MAKEFRTLSLSRGYFFCLEGEASVEPMGNVLEVRGIALDENERKKERSEHGYLTPAHRDQYD